MTQIAEPTIQTPHILSLNEQQLKDWLKEMNEPAFRSGQIRHWLYKERVLDPERMLNISKSLRQKLSEGFTWSLPTIISRLDSEDGASKLLLKTASNQMIEAVILRYEGRVSLCVSSQVGCKLACNFCQTGKLGFFRHLGSGEILGQYLLAQQIVDSEQRRISHVVFMGMGEPLDNYQNVIHAVNTLIAPEALGLSARNVTISTSGLVPQIEKLANDTRAALAISLHAPNDDLRSSLMPINRKYPLADLKNALINYQQATGQMLTMEYILIKGANSSVAQAKELVRYLHGLKAKINLIPFNPHPGLPYERPDADEIRNFQKYLADRGYPSPVRYSKGMEVSGACGQLAAKTYEQINNQPLRRNVIVSMDAAQV